MRIEVGGRELSLMATAVCVTYLSLVGVPPRLELAAVRAARSVHADGLADRMLRSAALRSSSTDLGVVAALRELARELRSQGRHAEASAHLDHALFLGQRALGPHHPDLAGLLDEQALVWLERGDLARALEQQERALEIRILAFGVRDARVGLTLEHLADLERRAGRLEDAMRLARRALATQEQTHPAGHPHVVRSLGRIGALHRARDEVPLAILYLSRALDLSRDALRLRSADIAADDFAAALRYERGVILRELGILRREQGNMRSARRLFARAFALHAGGPDAAARQAETIEQLAQTWLAEGRPEAARVHLRVAARLAEERPRIPALRASLHDQLAVRHAQAGVPEQALRHRELSRAIRRRAGVPTSRWPSG